jgi:hypothetical protein
MLKGSKKYNFLVLDRLNGADVHSIFLFALSLKRVTEKEEIACFHLNAILILTS